MPLFSPRFRLFYTLVIFYLFMPNNGFSQSKTILFTAAQNEVLPKNENLSPFDLSLKIVECCFD